MQAGDVVDRDGCLRPEHDRRGPGRAEARVPARRHRHRRHVVAAHRRRHRGASSRSESFARAHGLEPLAVVRGFAVSGCDPEVDGHRPRAAPSARCSSAPGCTIADIDVVELNEAFAVAVAGRASTSSASTRPRVNVDGGAIALGHPLGATGARITGKAAQLLRRSGGRYAVATQCIGGGQGIATLLEAVE